jgi:hypothetical protein
VSVVNDRWVGKRVRRRARMPGTRAGRTARRAERPCRYACHSRCDRPECADRVWLVRGEGRAGRYNWQRAGVGAGSAGVRGLHAQSRRAELPRCRHRRTHSHGRDRQELAGIPAAHRSGERPAPAAVLAFAGCMRPGPVAGAFDREQEVVSSLDHPDRARAGQPEHPEPVVGVRLYERGRTVSIGQAYAGVLNAS